MSTIPAAKAVAVVADLLERLDDANPDVGRGPSRSVLIRQAERLLDLEEKVLTRAEVDIAAAHRDVVIGTLMVALRKALELGAFSGDRLPIKVWRDEFKPVFDEALRVARRAP